MRVPCPTCDRKGTVNVRHDGPMCYVGPNGESWPQEMCQSCCGSGWVDQPERVRVTREMAIDAGDKSLEGIEIDW